MSDELQKPDKPEEPTVLDYFKSLFRFGQAEKIQLPEFVEEEKTEAIQPMPAETAVTASEVGPVETAQASSSFPWRSLLAFAFALIGQNTLEPPHLDPIFGFGFYGIALGFLGWAIYTNEWRLASLYSHSPARRSADLSSYCPVDQHCAGTLGLLHAGRQSIYATQCDPLGARHSVFDLGAVAEEAGLALHCCPYQCIF